MAHSAVEMADSRLWLEFAQRAEGASDDRIPSSEEASILSSFLCDRGSGIGAEESYIEPLTGVARHPYAPLGCRQAKHVPVPPHHHLMNTSYLIISNWCKARSGGVGGSSSSRASGGREGDHLAHGGTSSARQRAEGSGSRRPSSFYFDLGCGGGSFDTYGVDQWSARERQRSPPSAHLQSSGSSTGSGAATPRAGDSSSHLIRVNQTGGGPKAHHNSVAQFVSMYRRNCIEFDRIFAWESQRFEPLDWWAPLPVSIRSKLTFFNIGVETEPSRGDGSVLRLLNESTTESDFVVLKVSSL